MEFVFGNVEFIVLVFFTYECMGVAKGFVMCGNQAICYSQRGFVWPMCMWGVVVGLSLCIPLFASVFVILFPMMPMWAHALCM